MTPAQIANDRIRAQRISATTFTRPEEAVAWLGGVQAQDYLGALWAVGLRLTEASEQDVERALAQGSIVRTWPMRGTLHFVAAADARWMTELLAPRAAAAASSRLRALGIDEPVLARARRALVKNLEGGRQLTRPAAYRVLEGARIVTGGQRGIHVLWRLAHDCLLCFGPRDGKQPTFVLFEEWLPQAKPRRREEALAELARRYFIGHGPATIADFAWWSGLKLADARLAADLAGKGIEGEMIGGQRFLYARGRGQSSAPSRARAFVLPAFDEFLVGYTDRSAVVDASYARRVNAGGGILNPTIIVDGRVVGTWKRRITRRGVIFTPTPFGKLGGPETRALATAAERYARFLGLELSGLVMLETGP